VTQVLHIAFGTMIATVSSPKKPHEPWAHRSVVSYTPQGLLQLFEVGLIAFAVIAIGFILWPISAAIVQVLLDKYRRNVVLDGRKCSTCDYDIRASTRRCPECGTPIPPPKLRRSRLYSSYVVPRRR